MQNKLSWDESWLALPLVRCIDTEENYMPWAYQIRLEIYESYLYIGRRVNVSTCCTAQKHEECWNQISIINETGYYPSTLPFKYCTILLAVTPHASQSWPKLHACPRSHPRLKSGDVSNMLQCPWTEIRFRPSGHDQNNQRVSYKPISLIMLIWFQHSSCFCAVQHVEIFQSASSDSPPM